MVTISHHQPVTRIVDLAHMGIDVGGDFSLQRRGEHLACAAADDLIEQRPPG